MCCMFTCVGWIIDLVQRLWTFTMSCCISSAICCGLFTASMSGVALGYNYSLAEYIDLKETNVSVYLKRGVFDDEIADDMEWRRHGGGSHLPVAGHLKDQNLLTADSQNNDLRRMEPARRMEDVMFDSNDRNQFEGGLMKLTAKPFDARTPPPTPLPDTPKSFGENSFVVKTDQPQPIDELKEVQSLINRRKMESARLPSELKPYSIPDEKYLAYAPGYPVGTPDASGRRMLMMPRSSTPDSLRNAVPKHIDRQAWINPKLPLEQQVTEYVDYGDYEAAARNRFGSATYPPPVTPRPRPLRPTPPPLRYRPRPTNTLIQSRKETTPVLLNDKPDEDLEALKRNLLSDTEGEMKVEDIGKKMDEQAKKISIDDYEEDIKGLPVRKKRDTGEKTIENLNNDVTTEVVTNLKNLSQEVNNKGKVGEHYSIIHKLIAIFKNVDAGALDNAKMPSDKNSKILSMESSTDKNLIKVLKSTITSTIY